MQGGRRREEGLRPKPGPCAGEMAGPAGGFGMQNGPGLEAGGQAGTAISCHCVSIFLLAAGYRDPVFLLNCCPTSRNLSGVSRGSCVVAAKAMTRMCSSQIAARKGGFLQMPYPAVASGPEPPGLWWCGCPGGAAVQAVLGVPQGPARSALHLFQKQPCLSELPPRTPSHPNQQRGSEGCGLPLASRSKDHVNM